MKKITPKEYIEFYEFWLLNYQTRNIEYTTELESFLNITENYGPRIRSLNPIRNHIDIALIDKYLKEIDKSLKSDPDDMTAASSTSDLMQKIKKLQSDIRMRINTFFDGAEETKINEEIKTVTSFFSNYGRFLHSKSKYNSDDLVREVERNGFIKKNVANETLQSPKFESIKTIPYEHAINIATKQRTDKMSITISLDCDFEIIKREFEVCYHKRMATVHFEHDIDNALKEGLISSPADIFQSDNPQEYLSEAYSKHVSEEKKSTLALMKYKIENNPNASFKLDDVPRAVGLWIWDFLTEKYGRDSHPRGALTEAVKELRQRFNVKQYSESRPEVIESKYRKTCECIEACEVLPF